MAAKGRSILKKLLIAIVIVIVILLILPFFINVDRYRPAIVSEIERDTGRRVEIGRLSIRFLPKISVVIQDFALGNPAGFPSGSFVTAGRIAANLQLGPLLHRQLVVNSIEIQNPVITLLSKGQQWNFASPAANAVRHASYSIPLQTTVDELVISGAHVILAHVLSSGGVSPPALEAMGVRIDLKPVDLGTFLAPASMSPEGTGARIPLLLTGFDTGAAPQSTSASQVTAQGSLAAKVVRYGQVNLINLKSNVALDPAELTLNPFSFDVFDGKGTGNFRMNLARVNSPYQLTVNLAGVDMAKLLAAFPGGGGKMTGTLNATCLFSGDFAGRSDPWTGKRADGKLTIVRGRVPDLKLSKNVLEMMRIAGLGPTSGDIAAFSSISADFELQDGLLASRVITLLGNGLNATADGNTDLNRTADPALHYAGLARVKAAATPLTNALTSIVHMPVHDGMVDLPFHVAGTLNHPKFDVQPPPGMPAGLLGGNSLKPAQNSPGNLIEGIMGLFEKKPTKKR